MLSQTTGIIASGVFGLIIGSFLNVVILRFEDLKSIFTTRSHCPHCKKEISWYDLIPFFSYIALAGKCRACKAGISMQYPLVEVGTGLIFAALFCKFGLSIQFGFLLAIISILIVVFTYDILHYLVADILVWIAIGLWVLYLAISYLLSPNLSFLSSIYGGLLWGGFLALMVVLSREKWMGAGDIKLGFLLGAMVAWPNVLVALFFTFSLGGIFGIILIALKRKGMKDMVPFAPFMILGMLITLFFGQVILDWYMGGLWM